MITGLSIPLEKEKIPKNVNIQTYLPTKQLSPFIKTYLVIESQHEMVNRVLPGTSLVMAFRYKGEVNYLENDSTISLPPFVVSGLRKSGRLINYSKNAGNILAIFKETGAAAFFTEPVHELFENSYPLYNFKGYKNLSILESQLASTFDNTERVQLVEQFLLSKLNTQTTDKLVLTALQKIEAGNGTIKMKDLASSLYISQDAFEKRFRKAVGAPAKQFSSIVRMNSLIHKKRKSQTLTDTAFDAGYFDQPHFNKDFKLFTGQTPTDFFKSPRLW